MEIKSAEFVISNTKVDLCPKGNLPEYAFIGRSNVGKSSLINMLTRKPKLAMTSATPGKTLLINHFLVNKEWYLVDLPGYGYAARGKKQVDKIQKIIEDYILEREQMTNLFVLIDIRLEPQKIDLEFFEWLGENGVPFAIIFTKADKLSAGKARPCRRRRPSSLDDGGISGLFSSGGPSVRFLTRYDGEVSEPLVGRQGSRVYMRVARGSASLLPSHGRGIWPRDVLKKVSRGLSRVEAGNAGFPRVVQVTSVGFSRWL